MTDAIDDDLYRRTEALLEPGEIELNAAIVHTELGGDEEPKLHRLTLEVGDIIAEHALDGEDWYVHSGNDDPDFGLNQHQGLTVEGDEFVWECQQLLREGTFDVVFYYEAANDQDVIVEAIDDVVAGVVGVRER